MDPNFTCREASAARLAPSLACSEAEHQPLTAKLAINLAFQMGYFAYFIYSNPISTNFGAGSKPYMTNLGTKSYHKETQILDENYKKMFLSI